MQEKILVIQTEATISKLLDSKYHVIIKQDGLEAIEWLDKGNYADLIMADSNMPYLSSFDFIKEIRSRSYLKYIPIVIFSDLEHITDRSLYLQMGASDFLVKPVSKAQLKQRMAQLINGGFYKATENAA